MTKQDEARRKRLRRQLADAGDAVDVATEDLRWLLDEVGRLQQSNDRLRRQNRRLRLKHQGSEPSPDRADEDDRE